MLYEAFDEVSDIFVGHFAHQLVRPRIELWIHDVPAEKLDIIRNPKVTGPIWKVCEVCFADVLEPGGVRDNRFNFFFFGIGDRKEIFGRD
ncbi:hypothetical protein [Agrobacterium rubi]|uniref:hypothetical protein n=1 Tax=Agrobacterium rubi TaxID=28099 RepID=UPI001571FBCC|nr:hypothetical protein [Agrobacterium rubi]NTF08901.1 hypothetical protein [Agrobacterium rubi]